MYHINKCMFFHGFLIAMISLCNYFIKINEAAATACNAGQRTLCNSRCGLLSILSCDYSSTSGAVSCVCGCDSLILEIYGEIACQWATQTHGYGCNSGGFCTFSHCATKEFYCFSFVIEDCAVNSRVKCHRNHLFDASATSRECVCQYVTSYTETQECYEYSYYGASCESSCPSYQLPTGYTWGKRQSKWVGGAITDCRVYVPAGCDSSGCYDSHYCPYVE